jgi:ATP-dependent Clp protease adaptor protein ClpS
MSKDTEQLTPDAPAAAVAPAKQKPAPRTAERPKLQPPYAVILHNDPINGFDFVVGVLMKVFRYGGGKAFWMTLKAHTAGRCVVWSGSLEVAELKVEQLRAAGPDPRKVAEGAKPLKVTAEPLPG